MSSINAQKFDRELKKGGAELLVLSLLEARQRHGYELRKLIETRSDGVLKFNAASLYPRCSTGWKSAVGSKVNGWRRPDSGGGAIAFLNDLWSRVSSPTVREGCGSPPSRSGY